MEIVQLLFQDPQGILTIISALVGVASAISAALRAIANVTPNTADDEFAGSFSRVVGRIQKMLDRLALNPDSSKARRK